MTSPPSTAPDAGRAPALAAVVLTSILWGTTGTAASFAPEVPSFAIAAVSLGLGGILQALIALPALRAARARILARPGLLAVGALSVFVYPLAFYTSMRLSGVAIGTVVSLATAPLFAGLIEAATEKTRPKPRWVAAAVLGAIGSALLAASRDPAGPGAGAGALELGIGLALVAGLAYAAYSWAARRFMEEGVARSAAMGAVFGAGGLLLMPVLVLTGAPLLSGPRAFGVGAYMALVPMFLGYVLFGYGLTRLRTSTVTLLTLIEPGVAALLAVLIVGERLSLLGWVGLTIIAASLLVLVAPTPRARPAE